MQPAPRAVSTCPSCGGPLEETSCGRFGCMACLLRAGIGSEEEDLTQDSTSNAFEDGVRFGVYEIERHPDGSLGELARGAMGVTYSAIDTTVPRRGALKILKIEVAGRSVDAHE